MTDRNVEHGGREAARLIVDHDERIANVGVDDDRAHLRRQVRARENASTRRHVDGNVLFGVAVFLDDQRVTAGLYLYITRNCPEHRAVFGVDFHRRAFFAVDAHRSQNRDEVERNILFAADCEIDVVALGGFVTGEL